MNKLLKNTRFLLESCAVILFYGVVKIMPHSILCLTAEISGRILYILPGFKKIPIANLKTVFPDYDKRKINDIAKKSFVNLVKTVLELFWFSNSPARLNKYAAISPQCQKMIDEHISRHENIIFVTPHLGNWEATGLKIAVSSGLDFAVIARPLRNPFLNRLVKSSRSAFGTDVIEAKGAGKDMFKALKAGKSMATLIDQNTRVRDGGVFVNFAGLPIPASRAPAIFTRRSNVKLYVGGGVRNKDGVITTFSEPLPKPESEYTEEQDIIQDLMTITEKYIRRYPEQYLWFYKRFQYIPREADDTLKARYPYYSSVASDKFYHKQKHKD